MNKLRIGFFGDSFCAKNDISEDNDYETYIKKIEKHYNADIVNLGVVGSSIYDTLLLQLSPYIEDNNVPDVCVFVWTNIGRLYNKKIRHINCYPADYVYGLTKTLEDKNILDAARTYYRYLQDDDLDIFHARSAFHYIDDIILPKLAPKTKIIHLWSFGNLENGIIEYLHNWKTGVEIRPALVTLVSSNGVLNNSFDPNHLSGECKNDIVFNWIKNAIDNYENGRMIYESSTV